jgi:H+/Cl- antiporter ClcA
MSKFALVIGGAIYWFVLHRYGWLYMGEATLICAVTGLLGYWLRGMYEFQRDETPNFYGEVREVWTPWHILCFVSGGIVLAGITRLLE